MDGAYTDENPIYTFNFDGAHEVFLLVQNAYGCYDSTMQTITPPLYIYGPNSFTPDGDNLNETFKFKGIGIEFFEMLIYDRWGELLFKTNDINVGWDGTYKGELVPAGVYVYRVTAASFENIKTNYTGSINLIR